MTTAVVWLIVFYGRVYGGALTQVQTVMFPTVEACEQVSKNAGGHSVCIQTTVLVPK